MNLKLKIFFCYLYQFFICVQANQPCLFKACSCNNLIIDCSNYIKSKKNFAIMRDKTISSKNFYHFLANGHQNVVKLTDDQFTNASFKEMRFTNYEGLIISANTFNKIIEIKNLQFNLIKNLSISSNANEFAHLKNKLHRLEITKINLNDLTKYLNILKTLAGTIHSLDMSNNNLEYIPDLSFMLKLVSLELGNNKIKQLQLFRISSLHLNASSSMLPTSLQRLLFPNNLIKELNAEALSKLNHLKEIDLSNNQIEVLQNYAFDRISENATAYLSINLNHNPIRKIENKAFCSKNHMKPIKITELGLWIDKKNSKVTNDIINSCIFKEAAIEKFFFSYTKCDCNIKLIEKNENTINCENYMNETNNKCKEFNLNNKEFEAGCRMHNFSCENYSLQTLNNGILLDPSRLIITFFLLKSFFFFVLNN